MVLLLAAFVVYQVLGPGLPALRHDWRIPSEQISLGGWFQVLISPWLTVGMGEPQPYPTFYLIGFLLWPLQYFASPTILTGLVIGLTIAIISLATISLAEEAGANESAAYALAACATLNPWIFSKYVAGHTLMVLGLGLCLAFLAEATRRVPRAGMLVALAALSITQLEFSLIATPLILCWCLKTRRMLPLAALLAALVPIAAGIIGRWATLAQTPFVLQWERDQAIPYSLGIRLLDNHYTVPFEHFGWVLAVLPILALVGTVVSWKQRSTQIVAITGIAALLYAGALTSPFAALDAWLILHVKEAGVFRESYDLIGVVSVAYVLLASRAAAAFRWARYAIVLVAAYCAAIWIFFPLHADFVSADLIPRVSFPPNPSVRIALFPPYQPMMLGAVGSGYDPDLYLQPGRATPINEFLPTYPVDYAFGTALRTGNVEPLQDLGVSFFVNRRYLESDWTSLRFQQIDMHPETVRFTRFRLDSPGIASTTAGLPTVTSDVHALSANATLVTDSADANLERFVPDSATIDPAAGWVDARLGFTTNPTWSNPYGGVVTTSDLPLQLTRANESVLAVVRGSLDSGKTRVSGDTLGLQWLRLPRDTTALVCHGECMIAVAASISRVNVAKPAKWYAASVKWLSPWAAVIRSNGLAYTTLRFSERYDPFWSVVGFSNASHVRLVGSVNGWVVPGSPAQVLVVNLMAAAQWTLEILAFLAIIALTFAGARFPSVYDQNGAP